MFRPLLLLLIAASFLTALSLADEPQATNSTDAPLEAPEVAKRVEQLWDVTWDRFYLPQTHLFYDYLSSY
ncbi:MAG: hypothetical protein ACIALR_16835, partial [Blastopirellula sp. JB062]